MTKKLVMIVHGIGEQIEGATVSELVGGLVGDLPYETTSDVVEVQDKHLAHSPRAVERFPAHRRVVKANGTEFDFVEVFWADLSRGAKGTTRVIYDFLLMILGLGYIAQTSVNEAFPDPKSGGTDLRFDQFLPRTLRYLVGHFVTIFHAVLLPLNVIAALAFTLMLGVGQLEQRFDLRAEFWNYSIDLSVVLAAGLAALWGRFILNNRRGIMMRKFGKGLRWISAGVAVGAVALAISNISLIDGFRICDARYFTANLRMSCDVAEYTLLLPSLLGVVFIYLLFLIVTQWALDRAQGDVRAIRKERNLFYQSCGLMAILFAVVSLVLWVVFVRAAMPFASDTVFRPEHIHALGYMVLPGSAPLFLALLVIIIGAGVLFKQRADWQKEWRSLERKREEAADHTPNKEYNEHMREVPRVIIATAVSKAITIASIGLFILLPLYGLRFEQLLNFAFCGQDCTDIVVLAAVGNIDLIVVLYYFSFAFALFFISLFFIPQTKDILALVVGTGKDVIGYFARSHYPLTPAQDEGPIEKWAKSRINGRFHQVFRRFWSEDRYDELIVVAHSQGGVVAVESIEALPDEVLKKTRFVSLGTPVGHLYNFYFPIEFNRSRRDVLQDFGPKGRGMLSWSNIYRADDYVGTWINRVYPEPDETGKPIPADWPVNHIIDLKGHIGYWFDNEVRDLLFKAEFAELAPDFGPEPPKTSSKAPRKTPRKRSQPSKGQA